MQCYKDKILHGHFLNSCSDYLQIFQKSSNKGSELTSGTCKNPESKWSFRFKKKNKNKLAPVFGNELKSIPKFTDSTVLHERELPKFLVKVIKKIEREIDTTGLYRINGVATDVEKIR